MKDDIMTKTLEFLIDAIKDFLLSLLLVIIIPFWLLAGLVLAGIGKIWETVRFLNKKKEKQNYE